MICTIVPVTRCPGVNVGFLLLKVAWGFPVMLSYKHETRGMVGGPVGFSMLFLR